MAIKIHALRALVDNYIWVIEHGDSLTIVDPGASEPVLSFIEQQGLTLKNILITHHHYDHVGGVAALCTRFPKVNLFGPDLHRIAQVHNEHLTTRTAKALSTLSDLPIKVISEAERLDIPDCGTWQVMYTPGHTFDHLSYYQPGRLFCADTLFSAGCGRALTNEPELLYASLCRLAQLPDATLIYPAHEYTLNNLAFAAHIEPDNQAVAHHKSLVQKHLAQGKPSLPSNLGLEKQINPFLRCALPNVQQSVEALSGLKLRSPESVFVTLRALKDVF